MNITIKFHKERETKGAVRYQEIDQNGIALGMQESVVGTLYIRKNKIVGNIPERIELTIKSTP